MPKYLPRWRARRAVMAIAITAVLMWCYVGSWGAVSWLRGRQGSPFAGEIERTVYAPLRNFSEATLPGSRTLRVFRKWCFWRGMNMPLTWHDAAALSDHFEHLGSESRQSVGGTPAVEEAQPSTPAVTMPDIQIEGLGTFTPHSLHGEVYCYERLIQFRGQTVALIVYPADDDTPPDPAAQAELARMFSRFQEQLDGALSELPPPLRKLCSEYRINVDQLTDDQLFSDLYWQNIKLQPEGTIECYASNPRVSRSLDIVIGFTPEMTVDYVHFDG